MTASADTERGPESPPSNAARSRTQRAFLTGSPAAIVFGGAPPSWTHVLLTSSVASVMLYVLGGIALSRTNWQPTARVVPPPLEVELLAPPPPPPPATPEPEPPPPPPVAKPAKVVERTVEKAPAPPPAEPPPEPSNEPPPPAEAGQVVAAEPDAPADFTSFDIASGKGARYRGGVTASNGTNTQAVHAPVLARSAAPGSGGNVSLAQPVRLEVRDWTCPWPEQADLLAVDEERVVLKVDVDVDGRVSAASVLTDPGYGFGAAALRCARQHRFLPATDIAGRPIAASSPPIRVRFSR
ncbi:MAG: hypothetical protein RL033_8143 [Pseudomonadota bacterium]